MQVASGDSGSLSQKRNGWAASEVGSPREGRKKESMASHGKAGKLRTDFVSLDIGFRAS